MRLFFSVSPEPKLSSSAGLEGGKKKQLDVRQELHKTGLENIIIFCWQVSVHLSMDISRSRKT